jgi:tetratricopeptide (TPR) repeat protein
MTHLKVEEISRFAEGNANKAERERFMEHIAQCEDCRIAYSATLEFVESERVKKKCLKLPGTPKIKIPPFLHSIGDILAKKRLVTAFSAITVIITGVILFNIYSNMSYSEMYKQQREIFRGNEVKNEFSAFDDILMGNFRAVRAGIFVEDLFLMLKNSDEKNMENTLALLNKELKLLLRDNYNKLFPAPVKAKEKELKKVVLVINESCEKSLTEAFQFGCFVEKTIFNTFKAKCADKDEVMRFLKIAEKNTFHRDVIENLKRVNDITDIEKYRKIFLDIRDIYQFSDYMDTKIKDHKWAKSAFNVFERVKNAADKKESNEAKLLIVNARIKLYAVAFPDGRIIINPETLYICYSDSGKQLGDCRLAFILGHELAHLADEDFRHRDSLQAWEKKRFSGQMDRASEDFGKHKHKELEADKLGVIYAAMAGYDVSALFGKQDNFFNHWESQIGRENIRRDSNKYPSLDERTANVRSRLKAVAGKVELFRAGVLFYQMGDNERAKEVFEAFAEYYPAREVYNNIGAFYLNAAQMMLSQHFKEEYFRFRVFSVIDYSTSAVLLRGVELEEIHIYLEDAITYFNKAARRDKTDRACRYNLSAAYLWGKKYNDALKICNSILETHPQDVNALNNKAIALYYSKGKNSDSAWEAVGLLQKAYRLEPGNLGVLYNLGSLKLNERKELWERYLNLPAAPRDMFYKHVYTKLTEKSPPKLSAPEVPKPPNDIEIGMAFEKVEEKWGKANTNSFELSEGLPKTSIHVLVKDNIRVVALETGLNFKENKVVIIEKELPVEKKTETLVAILGPPQLIVRHGSGNFYVYEEQNFSVKEINGKVHSLIWFANEKI